MKLLINWLNNAVKAVLEFFKPKQFFSWQIVFFLSLFSWLMAALTIENIDGWLASLFSADTPPNETPSAPLITPATWALFTMGWIFFVIAVGWLLAKQKFNIPLLDIEIKPAIWVTSALTSVFLFHAWDSENLPMAFMSWPLIFAGYAALSKVFQLSDNRFAIPKVEVRQQVVLITLICLVISCWFRFHFRVQSWIMEDYPALRIVDFASTRFLVPLGSPLPVIEVAERSLQDELGELPLPEVRRWLVRTDEHLPILNQKFQLRLQAAGVEPDWELIIIPDLISNPTFTLQLFPVPDVRGPEDAEEQRGDRPRPPEYFGIEKQCIVESTDETDLGTNLETDEELGQEGDRPISISPDPSQVTCTPEVSLVF